MPLLADMYIAIPGNIAEVQAVDNAVTIGAITGMC
jgi:hypothetical protein